MAADLANQVVTLGHLWNNEGKRAYSKERFQDEGILPGEEERLDEPETRDMTTKSAKKEASAAAVPSDYLHSRGRAPYPMAWHPAAHSSYLG